MIGLQKIDIIEHGTATHEFDTHYRSNMGREYGAYIWFIIKFYEIMDGEYLFASANLNKHQRRRRFRQKLLRKNISLGRVGNKRKARIMDYEYECDFYPTKHGKRKLMSAEIRPFGNWFETFIAPMKMFYQTGEYSNGFIFTNSDIIHSRPKQFWELLYRQLVVDNAPEVGHYMEKASTFIFQPTACKHTLLDCMYKNGWCAAFVNFAIKLPFDFGKVTVLQNNRKSYNIRNRKKISTFLLQNKLVHFIVTKYLDTQNVELLLAQDIQIDQGMQPMQRFHRDHRCGHCVAIVVAMHICGENIGTCFASGTHKDEYDDTPCTTNFEEANGNLVIYDPYMYHAGRKKDSYESETGRIFSIFVPKECKLKNELRKSL